MQFRPTFSEAILMKNPDALLFGALAVLACGCYSWSTINTPVATGPLDGNPKFVQVTRTDATSVTLRDPVMSADSLVGQSYIRGQGDVRLAISKTDIKNLKTSTFSAERTVGAVVGIGAAAAFALYLALRNTDLWTTCTPSPC